MLRRVSKDGKPGFQNRRTGRIYTFEPGNVRDRDRAVRLAGGSVRTETVDQAFRADIVHMADSEVLDMIPADVQTEIKARDDHPLYKVFSIGHEGTARGRLVGVGYTTVQYLRDAVRKIGDKLKIGTKVFSGHGSTNSHEGRKPIGTVVGRHVRQMAGKLHTLAAIYIHPENRDVDHDIASIEARVRYQEDLDGVSVRDVDEITGIALGRTGTDEPGFPGARLIAAFQAFAENESHKGKRGNDMDLATIQEAIEDNGFTPSDVFDRATLEKDTTVEEIVKKGKDTEFRHAKRVEKQRDALQDDLSNAKEDHAKEIAGLRRELLINGAGTVLSKLIGEDGRKLSDRKKAFVEREFDERFHSESEDDKGLEKDIDSFVDQSLERYDQAAKLFGVEETNESDPSDGETPPHESAGSGSDLTKPENNVLIMDQVG